MRLLHTADWHLGRVFQHVSLLEDQRAALDGVFERVVERAPDVLVIAGDVFDRANPRREAIDLFDRFLGRVYRETAAAIVVIAGNHDAPERIGYGGALHDPNRVLIRGPLDRGLEPLILEDPDGPVAVSALPFAGPFAARAHYDDASIQTPEDVLRRQVDEAREHVPSGARWVIAAHAFVQGGEASESERALDMIGNIETASASVFEGADYVALGHLHRAQSVGAPHIRYSGSLMRYGFDEVDVEKSMTLVDLGSVGSLDIRAIPLAAPRTLRVVEGLFDEILRLGPMGNADDFVKARLFDLTPIPDAMGRLRAVYPNAVQIEWARRREAGALTGEPAEHVRGRDPADVFAAFFGDVTGGELEPGPRDTVASLLAELSGEEG
jgi:exonuclease SbcD